MHLENLQNQPKFASRSPVVIYELPQQIRDSHYRLIKLD